jgi:hypothetical protein
MRAGSSRTTPLDIVTLVAGEQHFQQLAVELITGTLTALVCQSHCSSDSLANNEVGTARQTPAQIDLLGSASHGCRFASTEGMPELGRGCGVESAVQRVHRDVACDCHMPMRNAQPRVAPENVMMLCEAGSCS